MRSVTFLALPWCNLFLSALVFNLAFFFPETLGFMVLLTPVLFIFAKPLNFTFGLFWGCCILIPHSTWVLYVVGFYAPWWFCLLGYVLFVSYGALISGVWFWMAGFLMRKGAMTSNVGIKLVLFVSLFGYWGFIEYYAFWPLGIPLGYPMLNPGIPLASYAWFLRLVSVVVALLGNTTMPTVLPTITHLTPVTNRVINTNASWVNSPMGVGQKIYHRLVDVSSPACHLVSPETMFPFALNKYPEIVTLWGSALHDDEHWFLGSVYKHEGMVYQTVYWLQGRLSRHSHEEATADLIINFYVKKRLMPFAEYTPRIWRGVGDWLQNIWGEFAVPSRTLGVHYFDVSPTLRIVPQICLEFFYANSVTDFRRYQKPDTAVVIYFFANDSWFPAPFRSWMRRLAQLKSSLANIPVIFIGHRD